MSEVGVFPVFYCIYYFILAFRVTQSYFVRTLQILNNLECYQMCSVSILEWLLDQVLLTFGTKRAFRNCNSQINVFNDLKFFETQSTKLGYLIDDSLDTFFAAYG